MDGGLIVTTKDLELQYFAFPREGAFSDSFFFRFDDLAASLHTVQLLYRTMIMTTPTRKVSHGGGVVIKASRLD